MSSLNLYDVTDKNGSRSFNAHLTNGELSLHGYDFGAGTEEFWGDSEYEFDYYFDLAATEKLFKLIGCSSDMSDEEKLSLFKEKYHTPSCDMDIRGFCEENGVEYMFSNYVS